MMINFNDLSITDNLRIPGDPSQDKDDQAFEKWMQHTRGTTHQNKARTQQANANVGANQDPAMAVKNSIEVEQFTKVWQKSNTPYVMYKRLFSPSRQESDPSNEAGQSAHFDAPKSSLKFSSSLRSQTGYMPPIPVVQEGSEQQDGQDNEDNNTQEHTTPKPRDALKLVPKREPEPENGQAQEETTPESEEKVPSKPGDERLLNIQRKKERDSQNQRGGSGESDESDASSQSNQQDQPTSSARHSHPVLMPVHTKKEGDHTGSQESKGSREETIAASLNMDPADLASSAAELLLDPGPFGRLTRSIAGFCANSSVHAHGEWQGYIDIDQKILAETTLFMHLTIFDLLLHFRTTDSTSNERIQKHEQKLNASISLVLKTNGYPRVVKILLTY